MNALAKREIMVDQRAQQAATLRVW